MIEEEVRNLAAAAAAVVRPCTTFGRTANLLEGDVAVVVPDTASCTPLPSSRERPPQICRVRYRVIVGPEHQQQVVDYVQVVRD